MHVSCYLSRSLQNSWGGSQLRRPPRAPCPSSPSATASRLLPSAFARMQQGGKGGSALPPGAHTARKAGAQQSKQRVPTSLFSTHCDD